jgi:hypothetical protein
LPGAFLPAKLCHTENPGIAGAISVKAPMVVGGDLISSRTPLNFAPFATAMVVFLEST